MISYFNVLSKIMFLTEHFNEQTLISSKIRKMNLKVIKIMIMLKIMLSDKIVHEKEYL